jgi:hypothetical protein
MGFLISGVFGGNYISLTEAYLDSYGVSKRSADARDNAVYDANGAYVSGGLRINGIVDVPAVMQGDDVVSPAAPNHRQEIDYVNPERWFIAVGDRNGALENYMYDRTNVRFTQFSLSYNIPVRQLNLPLRSASVGINGQNLFFLYNKMPYDPESVISTGRDNQGIDNNSLPPTRTLGFNIRVNF